MDSGESLATNETYSTDECIEDAITLRATKETSGRISVSSSAEPPAPPVSHHQQQQVVVQYQGFFYTTYTMEKIKSAQEHFKARSGDVFICSFPKTGTTWLKSLAFSIVTRDQYKDDNYSHSPLLSNIPHHCVPYIEHNFDRPFGEFLRGKHRLAATHIPFTSLPCSVVTALHSGACKIIYICRDPKDVMVSSWHFFTHAVGEITLEESFNLFYEGKSMFDPYWQHILGYWEAKRKYPEHVMFIRYEDLKRDPAGFHVKRLADFLGCPFSSQEVEAGEVGKIIELHVQLR